MSSNLIAVETGLQELHPSNPQTTLGVLVLCFLLPFLKSRPTVEENDGLFTAFLEMFRNSDQFIAHMSAEYGIYVYLFLFTVYF